MKRTGPTSRADLTQDAIVAALERCGVQVLRVGYPLDLLCYGGPPGAKRTLLLECKTGTGGFTKAQVEFMVHWGGEVHVCRTPEEAIKAVLGAEVLK